MRMIIHVDYHMNLLKASMLLFQAYEESELNLCVAKVEVVPVLTN
jgi:hypothetical protein